MSAPIGMEKVAPHRMLLALCPVLGLGVVQLLLQLRVTAAVRPLIPMEMHRFFTGASVIMSMSHLVGPVILWLIVAHMAHTLAVLFGGDGSERTLLESLGFCTLPLLFFFSLAAVVTSAVVQSLPLTRVEDLIPLLRSNVPVALGRAGVQFGALWSLYLMTRAIRTQYRIRMWKAITTVLAPAVLFMCIAAWVQT